MQKEKKKNKLFRYILKIALWLVGICVSIILLAALLIYIFQDKIEQKVVNSINEQLNSEIKVRDINTSLFHNFPMVSVVFNDVSASDATPEKQAKLFQAKKLSLEFNIIDIITSRYNIRQIGLNDGDIWLKIYNNGSDNFHIIKKTNHQKAKKENSAFLLNKVYFNNVHGSFFNEKINQKYFFYFYKAKASGHFYNDDYKFKLSTTMQIDTLHFANKDFVTNTKTKFSGSIEVKSKKNSLSFNNAKIEIANVDLLTSGSINYGEGHEFLDISVKSDKSKLNDVINLLPEEYKDFFKDFKCGGQITIESNITGGYGQDAMPAIDLSMQLDDGFVKRKENNTSLKKIKLKTTLYASDCNKIETYTIVLKNFSAELNEKPISGNLKIENFDTPKINLNLGAKVSLSNVHQWLKLKDIKELSGDLQFNIHFDGSLKSIKNITAEDFISSKSHGNLVAQNAVLQAKEMSKPINIKLLNAHFSNTDLNIDEINLKYGSSDFFGEVFITDILPYIFTDKKTLNFNADLKSKNLDIVELFPENRTDKNNSEIKFSLPKNVSASIIYSADNLTYNKFGASNSRAKIILGNNRVFIDDFYLKTLGGSIYGLGSCEIKNKNVFMSLDANFKNIDIRESFIVFDNFGQKNLTSDHLRGRANVSLQLKLGFSETLQVDPASIIAKSNIEINDGEIIGYEPLIGIKKIIKNRDFYHIKFEKLTNSISISDKIINIPKTEINNNVMNLKISGNHSFDNDIEYHLEIKLSDLKNKKERTKPEDQYGYIVDDELGNPTFFIVIKGKDGKLEYTQLDKTALQAKVKEDIRTEKQNLKQIINKEFGFFKNDSTIKNYEKPKTNDNSKAFKVTWDEE